MSDRGWDDGRDPFDDLHVLDDLDGDGELVDFAKVHADDAFLDALGASLRGEPSSAPADDHFAAADAELAVLLTSWRDEVDSEPIGALVDPRLATDTVFTANARKQRRPRLLVPFAAAAAVLAIAFTGAGLAARDAQPGDTLWGLTKVLYTDHARSVEAAANVRNELTVAQAAIADGDLAEARTLLLSAGAKLPAVAVEDGQADLAAQHAALDALLPGSPANGVNPPPSANPTTAAPTTPSTGGTTKPTAPTTSVEPTVDPTTTSPSTPPSSTTEPTQTTTSTTEAPRADDPASEPADTGTVTTDGTTEAP